MATPSPGSTTSSERGAASEPTVTIDGQVLAYRPGQTVIEVAREAGIEIPHYCYHPGLSIAGNCRICMVEVQGWDRPQISCKLAPSPGMVVETQSALATEARRSTMEFLLVNHPLDCPICDQAGECHLQDYSYELGQGQSRATTPKTHAPKNVPFGAKIVYDGERCIKCTRCVRFTDEVTQTHELSMGMRSDHELVVMTSKGEFDTPYAMNIIDICPVGALTSKDFRFQSRLWFMDFAPSVCTGCARGCNVITGARQGKLLRLAPRENAAVNRWWMCDAGRLGYHYANVEDRLRAPRVRAADGSWQDAGWDEAIAAAARALATAKGGVLLDGGLTLEEMFVAATLADSLGGRARFSGAVGDDGDDFLIVNEKAANAQGAAALGIARAQEPAPAAVLFVERDANVPAALRDASGASVVFALAASQVPASAQVAFPLGSSAERDGVLVNVDGIAQRIESNPSAGPGDLLACVEVLEELLLELGVEGYEPLGRDGVLEAIAALPAFANVDLPAATRAGPAVGSAS
jgi:NADH-quinone oxidoreductase subunit G